MKYFDQETAIVKVTDRCDRCGPAARAYSLVQIGGNLLFFCGHHFRKYLPNLRKVADIIADETHRIPVKGVCVEADPESR